MPTATFSRRNNSGRRQASSDIEEDRPSQSRAREQVDDDESENERPKHRTNGGKRESVKSSRKAEKMRANDDEEDENEDDDDDEDEKIDIEHFHNQPLGRGDLKRLQGISQDWMQMEKQVRQNWRVVGDVAVAMAEVGEGAAGEEGLAELDAIMKDLIDIGEEMKAHEKVLDDIYQQVGQGEEINDAADKYQVGVAKKVDEYSRKTARQKYAKSEEYIMFKLGIHEIQFPDKPMPPVTEYLTKEDGDVSDDDELEMGGVSQNYLCPITLTTLKDPMTSQICGHSFSGDAIRSTFRGSRVPEIKCPASGCHKKIKLSDLKQNKELEKKAKAWERRNKRAAEDSGAEEVIE